MRLILCYMVAASQLLTGRDGCTDGRSVGVDDSDIAVVGGGDGVAASFVEYARNRFPQPPPPPPSARIGNSNNNETDSKTASISTRTEVAEEDSLSHNQQQQLLDTVPGDVVPQQQQQRTAALIQLPATSTIYAEGDEEDNALLTRSEYSPQGVPLSTTTSFPSLSTTTTTAAAPSSTVAPRRRCSILAQGLSLSSLVSRPARHALCLPRHPYLQAPIEVAQPWQFVCVTL